LHIGGPSATAYTRKFVEYQPDTTQTIHGRIRRTHHEIAHIFTSPPISVGDDDNNNDDGANDAEEEDFIQSAAQ
jgi:hypothetical protein